MKRRHHELRRPDLCRITMAAGFCEVGQTVVSKTFGHWVITTGRCGKRVWETAIRPPAALGQ